MWRSGTWLSRGLRVRSMVRLWLDLMIFKVFSNLRESMILFESYKWPRRTDFNSYREKHIRQLGKAITLWILAFNSKLADTSFIRAREIAWEPEDTVMCPGSLNAYGFHSVSLKVKSSVHIWSLKFLIIPIPTGGKILFSPTLPKTHKKNGTWAISGFHWVLGW